MCVNKRGSKNLQVKYRQKRMCETRKVTERMCVSNRVTDRMCVAKRFREKMCVKKKRDCIWVKERQKKSVLKKDSKNLC